MKVLLVNGSPHQHGCTDTALREVAKTLQENGVQTDFFWIGNKPISGCMGCGACYKNKACIVSDKVNEFTALAQDYDGFVFGSPVHYAGLSGSMTSFMDRVAYSLSARDPHPFKLKPAAAVVSARRAGTTAAFEQMNKYFMIQEMPVISSCYWNMVHGRTPEQVLQDEEGLQTMRVLGRNMAWFLRLREAGDKLGVPLPEQEDRIYTNFIR